MPSTATVAKYGLGVGAGLLLMGYSGQTYLWYGYQKVNPAIGYPDTSVGFTLVTAGIFLLGAMLAYVAFLKGISHTLAETDQSE